MYKIKIVYCALSLVLVSASTLPKLPKDVWHQLTEERQEQARLEWNTTPTDDKVPPRLKSDYDPMWSPPTIENELSPFFLNDNTKELAAVSQNLENNTEYKGRPLSPIFENIDSLDDVPDDENVDKEQHKIAKPEKLTERSKRLYDMSRPHGCDECGKRYERSEHLRRHQRTHTKQKPFQCKVCLRFFARNDNLSAHYKIHKN